MSGQRQVWQDRAKGIGIVLVVFGHVMRGLTGAHIAPDDATTQAIDYTLYLFHMPLFFLLAGLNVERSARRGATSFLKDKLHTIVWPYFLWSVAQGLVLVRMSGTTNIAIGYGDLAGILWAPISQFWFLYVLMLCHLAFLLSGGRRALLLPGAAIAFALSGYAPFLPAKFMFNFMFYVGGVFFSAALAAWLAPRRSWRDLAIAVALFAVSAYACRHDGFAFDSPACLPAAASGIAAVVLIANRMEGRIGHVAEVVGRMSMTIYILHLFAAGGARVVMQKLGAPADVWLYAVVATIVGVVAPMIAHVVFERLGLLAWLGLAAPRRAPDAKANAAFSAR